ncbi:hypothetical protein B7P43_G01979 [Cryptotermes secundus]|uniref:Mos1 transposase HTH domain-containing protein n=1 Tax=Cryptotermes secundus TaxID=105785 RepID=A0A2J7Q978_9NEOP|nr:hypothetical protein B7P43_G01979 [Cryptotermes secundus]
MTEQHDQRYCIKFSHKLGDTQVETIRKIQQAFGDDAMSNSRIKEWYNRFKDGRTSVDNEPRSGRPSTSRNENVIEQVRTLVMEDSRITVRELVNEIGVSTGSVHSILTEDLGMRSVSAKFVPKLLTMERKQRRLEIAQDMLDNADSNPNFLNTMITGDDSWVYGQQVIVLPHPPYSPDLAPRDFLIFHRFKAKLPGRRFQSSEVVNVTRDVVREFPPYMFQQCFLQLYQRWQTCIAANGNYFEGRCGSV